ncbi:MAG: energy transducer TonB [bacterium]
MILKKRHRFAPFESPTWSLIVKPESRFNRETRQSFTRTVDTKLLVKHKSPNADLKLQHKKVYELSLAVTLVLLITAFQSARHYLLAPASISKVNIKIEVADIPITKQIRRPSPPARPSVPIPTEEESIPEDVTIASTEIDFFDIPPPPSPPEKDEELPIFVAYDEPPQIIGGFVELQKHLKYPQIAVKAEIEGLVFVKVLVGVEGRIEKMEIIKAKPANIGFEESAMEAIKKVRWKPAKQRDKKIRVWVTIPVQFQLYSS